MRRKSADLARTALADMEHDLPFFARLPPEHRADLGLLVQAFVTAFADWIVKPTSGQTVTASVFASAPRELVRAISLPQTVELVRSAVATIEPRLPELATTPAAVQWLREAMLRYTRELAFAAAHVYASAAEVRGAWDARLEALVVDGLLRGDADRALLSRTTALGWRSADQVIAIAGRAPAAEAEAVLDVVHRAARDLEVDVLAAVHGTDLVVFVGSPVGPAAAAAALTACFGSGPVVLGVEVTGLSAAASSARDAVAALRAAPAWPSAPRPVSAAALLPERALAGEQAARAALLASVYEPLVAAGSDLLDTVSAYVEEAGTVDGAARLLFVHPNTVRYRLRRVAELTGLAPTEARAAFVLRVALVLGRLEFPPSADSADTALSHLDDRAAPDEPSQPELSHPELSQPDDAAARGALPSEQPLSHPDNSRPPDWSASEATRRRGRSKLGSGPATPGAPGRLPRRTGTVA
ncbi:MAG: hypothetical protein QOJ32_55 [Frankiaceae bacterium]|jgi:hypothetical protein|nr:hypothetical protein [Frankiaceae bacterium]